jgi:hypothetical protein
MNRSKEGEENMKPSNATVRSVKNRATLAAGIASLMIGVPAVASAAKDTLRCTALALQCESRMHECLARCDRVADRRAVRDPEHAELLRGNCTGVCEQRHDNAMQRLADRPVCQDPPGIAPSPQACEAKLLWAEANYHLCQARCYDRSDRRPEFDMDACMNTCSDRYADQVQTILDDPVCAGGRLTTP